MGRTIRTLNQRRAFIDVLTRTGNVVKACAAANMGRTAAYAWREADPVFREEWDAAIAEVLDCIEAKTIDQALTDDGPVGAQMRMFLLRHQRAEVYNPGMLLRHDAMRLELERRRSGNEWADDRRAGSRQRRADDLSQARSRTHRRGKRY
jgi:hypothetical protein